MCDTRHYSFHFSLRRGEVVVQQHCDSICSPFEYGYHYFIPSQPPKGKPISFRFRLELCLHQFIRFLILRQLFCLRLYCMWMPLLRCRLLRKPIVFTTFQKCSSYAFSRNNRYKLFLVVHLAQETYKIPLRSHKHLINGLYSDYRCRLLETSLG